MVTKIGELDPATDGVRGGPFDEGLVVLTVPFGDRIETVDDPLAALTVERPPA